MRTMKCVLIVLFLSGVVGCSAGSKPAPGGSTGPKQDPVATQKSFRPASPPAAAPGTSKAK
ncbi:MAG: hypothetical protein ABSG68_05290 [Thermoguttaceae bacterium]